MRIKLVIEPLGLDLVAVIMVMTTAAATNYPAVTI